MPFAVLVVLTVSSLFAVAPKAWAGPAPSRVGTHRGAHLANLRATVKSNLWMQRTSVRIDRRATRLRSRTPSRTVPIWKLPATHPKTTPLAALLRSSAVRMLTGQAAADGNVAVGPAFFGGRGFGLQVTFPSF